MHVTAERAAPAQRSHPSLRRSPEASARVLDEATLAQRRRTATVVGLASLAAVVGLLSAAIVRANGGSFTYVIDDPYIHLTIARNLAQHASYGIVPGVYESASSSPGWVTLLAGLIKVAPGTAVWLPLALNLLAGGAVLALVLRSQRFLFNLESPLVRGVAYVLLPLAMFLPGLVLVGMEHTLHALLAVAVLLMLARALRRPLSGRELAAAAALSLLAGAVRYETLFLAGGATLALLLVPSAPGGESAHGLVRRALARLRRRDVWAFLLPPLLVTALLAAINLHNGQYALPNSVLAKSGLGAGQGLVGWVPSAVAVGQTAISDLLMGVLLLAGVGYLAVRRLRGLESGLWLAWLVAAVLHMMYAKFGWYDRYQGYLVITGMWLALRSLSELGPIRRQRAALLVLALLVAAPGFKFATEADAANQAHLIYQHQYAMGSFLGAEYEGQTVMVNDIGEVSWRHAGGLDDIWALGSYDVLHAYRTSTMGPAFVERLAARDRVQVVAIWGALGHYIPPSFVEVARWSTSGTHRPDADNDIVFYAPSPAQASSLAQRMRDFAGRLPAGIEVLWSTPQA